MLVCRRCGVVYKHPRCMRGRGTESLPKDINASILSFTLPLSLLSPFATPLDFLLMRPSKTGLMLLSTPSTASNIASTSASTCTAVVEEEVETDMPSSHCFVEKPNAPQPKDDIQRSPRDARGLSEPPLLVEYVSDFFFPPQKPN